jgi:hypothetical protein
MRFLIILNKNNLKMNCFIIQYYFWKYLCRIPPKISIISIASRINAFCSTLSFSSPSDSLSQNLDSFASFLKILIR